MARPLGPLFDSPRQLLEKARRDLTRLEAATASGDDNARAGALLDACCAVYHVWDWIAALRPEHKAAAKKHGQASPSIRMCRDICNAGKHVELTRDVVGVVVREVDHTAMPHASEPIPATRAILRPSVKSIRTPKHLKIRSVEFGDHRATEAIRDAIKEWERFLQSVGL